MIDQNILNLVNQPVIDAANNSVTAAKTKVDAAASGVANQRTVRNRAARTAEAAIAELSPNAADLDELLAAQERKLSVLERVHAAAEQAHQRAKTAAEVALGIAHQPLYSYAVEMRIAASKAADAARETLKQAEAERDNANEILLYAVGRGCRDVCFKKWLDKAPLTFNSEYNLWGTQYHTAWWQGLNEDGTIKGAA